jgi:hypothetical protein
MSSFIFQKDCPEGGSELSADDVGREEREYVGGGEAVNQRSNS